MIITSRVGAKLEAPEIDFALDPDFAQHAAQAVSSRIVAEAEAIGGFMRGHSVWAIVGKLDTTNFTRPVFIEWCPDPTEGVEFRGGPWDGEIHPLHRESDGKPPRQWVLPPLQQVPSLDRETAIPVRPMETFHYRREGIDSEADRWVYLLDR